MNGKAKPYYNPDILNKIAKTSALNKPIIPYHLNRGCSQNCSFCTYFENQQYQYKTINKVTTELKQLTQETNAQHVSFVDQNILNDPEHVKNMAIRFQQENLNIKWGGLAIIIPRTQQYFNTLAAGGCNFFWHGIESASDTVLHRMQKHQTRNMIENTLKKEHRAGIKPIGLFVADYVDETWDEYMETVNFIKQNRYLIDGRGYGLHVFSDKQQPLYRDPDKFGVKLEESGDTNDQNSLVNRFDVEFTDSRDETVEERKQRRELKERYLLRTTRIELFLKNYARRYPLTFLRHQLRKLYMKPYPDASHHHA